MPHTVNTAMPELFACAVKHRSERAVNVENIHSQRQSDPAVPAYAGAAKGGPA